LTGASAVDEIPNVTTLSFPAQIADETCAIHERHGETGKHSTRARDLADIAMIAGQVDLYAPALSGHVRREERRRLQAGSLAEPLPASIRS
jgi:hypothetical protein